MTVYANVRLLGEPDPVAITVERGTIARVSPVRSFRAGQGEEVVDVDGRWAVPGLWDRHVHLNQWAVARRRVDVSSAESAHHAARLMRAALDARRSTVSANAAADDSVLVGFGFRDGVWSDPPSAAVLDDVFGEIPVVLVASDLHSVWLDSAAARLFDIPIDRSGLAREGLCFDLLRRLGDVPVEVLDRWVADAIAAASLRGIVGVVDVEMAWNVAAWRRRLAAGFDAMRVEVGVYEQDLERAISEGLSSGDRIASEAAARLPGADLVRMGPLKIIMDGSLNTRTAYCFRPYGAVGSEARGILSVNGDHLTELLKRAAAAGITGMVHAIGDEANVIALDSFARARARGTIEHVQLLRSEDVGRFARSGLTASIQPRHAVDDRLVTDRYWGDRSGDAFRMRSLLDAGIPVVLGSDAPVALLDPWVAIEAATVRTLPGGEPWHPEECLTVEEAIGCSTAVARERPQEGDDADVVFLDADPKSADAAGLLAMPVAATMVGGRIVAGTID